MTNGPESSDAQRRSQGASDVSVDAPAGSPERESRQRAGDREALRTDKALADKQVRPDDSANPPTRRQLRLLQQQRAAAGVQGAGPELADAGAATARDADVLVVDAPPAALRPAREGGRRDRRRRAQQDTPAEEKPVPAPRADGGKKTKANADVAGMTVEQALAARGALQAQARNQVTAMEAIQAKDPNAVDLELLAQQKALAERAAVLNRRTQSVQRTSDQDSEQATPAVNDPAAAHNLAMVTPLEFVRVPGMDQPVMRRPPTSHVPIVTSAAPPASAEVRHSRIPAGADAPAGAPLDPAEGAKPIGARSAFGLDPLDAKTAGLGRTRRLRFVALGVGGLGILALIISVAMIVGGLGG